MSLYSGYAGDSCRKEATWDSMSMNAHKLTYRPEIDGLRAIAVLLVLGFHAFPSKLSGGFIGVDIFFVISGCLITSIILKETDAGKWRYLDFYKRRILRLFPALIAVFVASYSFGWNSLFANEFKMLGKHLMASAGFFANYIYWLESGYFDAASEKKIFLHLWSLSVEEQFYLVWPIFLLVLIRLKQVQVGIVAVLLMSFLVNCIWQFSDKELLYFSGFSRFWELAVGGYWAYRQHLRKPFIGSQLSAQLPQSPAIALAVILLCAWLYSKDLAFPGFWGILPVVAVLIVIAEPGSGSVLHRFLASRPLVYVGLISYPLYLWHWPLLSYLGYLNADAEFPAYRLLALAAAFVLAILTYECFEWPIKRLKLKTQTIVSVALFICIALLGYIGYNTYSRNGLAFREAHSIRELTSNQVQKTPDCLSHFPEFELTFCRLSAGLENTSVILYGDSHAHQYFSALAAAYSRLGQGVLNIGWAGHPPVLEKNTSRTHQAKVSHLIDHLLAKGSLNTVVLSMAQPDYLSPTVESGLIQVINKFKQAGKQVIYIQDNPQLPFHPIDCIGMPPLRPAKITTCDMALSSVPASFFTIRERLASLITEQQVAVYDYLHLLCPEGHCKIREKDLLFYETDGYISQPAAVLMLKEFPLDRR